MLHSVGLECTCCYSKLLVCLLLRARGKGGRFEGGRGEGLREGGRFEGGGEGLREGGGED